MERFISVMCVIALALTAFSGVVFAETADSLYGLAVNTHADPDGVEMPITFSWKLKSDRVGAKQIAYKLELAAEKNFDQILWTKEEQSDLSYAIPFDGTLQSGTDYWWRVTVTTDAEEQLSASGHFLTGLLEETTVPFVKSGTVTGDACSYTVETTVYGGTGAASLVFNAKDANNNCMWQLNFSDNATVKLKPHTCIGGQYTALSAYIIDVTDAVGGIHGLRKGVQWKVAVTERGVTTYLNGKAVSEIPASAFGSLKPVVGLVGYRGSGSEFSFYDNLVVKNGEELLLSYDFEEYNPFSKGSLQDGLFLLDSIDGVVLPAHGEVYRTEFDSEKEVADAKLFAAALGVYDAYLNGVRLGEQELKAGYAESSERQYYNVFDVTALVQEKNALSAVVTSGWWNGQIVSNAESYKKQNGFWALLKVTYTDGSSEVISTDTHWRVLPYAPVLMGSIYEGETYDARISDQWKYAGYNDSGWYAAEISSDFTGVLSTSLGTDVWHREDLDRKVQSGYIYEGVKGADENHYGAVDKVAEIGNQPFTLLPGQTAVLDLGQNFAGREKLVLGGAAGTLVKVRHAEMLNESNGSMVRGNDGPEGSLYQKALRGVEATTRYILSGEGEETYSPAHTFYGFRYLELTATDPVTVYGVEGQVLTSVSEETATLVTADEDVNQLISNIRWGMLSNYLSIPTDCPQRNERAGWTADTQVFAVAGSYLSQSQEFLRDYLRSMRDTQREDGAYASVSPTNSFGLNYGAFGWADAGIIIPYELWKQYGDTAIVEEMYSSMQRYLDGFLASSDKKGGHHYYGDWLAYESNDTDVKNMLAVSYYAYDALMMSEMASALGKTEDADRYRQVYQAEKEYFIQQFVQADGTLKRSEQSVCLYALYLDLLPDAASVIAVTNQLTDNIRSKGNKLQTGFLGTKIILETLSEIGETELAYKLLLQHDNPSWLYTVDQGATTMWERWNSYSVENGFGSADMNSFNHYAYGAVAGWMYRYMAGIVPGTNGYKNFTLQPYPDQSLGSASAEYESVYGKICSAWSYEGETFTYTCTVPANTAATVMVPVAEGGVLHPQETLGLTFKEENDGYAVYLAEAGSYTFTVQLPEKEAGAEIFVRNANESVPAYLEFTGAKAQLPATVEAGKGAVVTLTAKAYNDVDYKMVWYDESGKELGTETITLAADKNRNVTVKPMSVSGKNLALGAKVTASSTVNNSWGAGNLTDGILIHTANDACGWSSASDGKNITTLVTPKTLVVDLGSKVSLDQWKLYPRTSGMYTTSTIYCFPVSYTVEISNDNNSWTKVATVTDGAVPQNMYQPVVGSLKDAVCGRYLRFTITAINAVDDYQNSHVQLSELAVFHTGEEDTAVNLARGAGLTVSSNVGGGWDKQYLIDGQTLGTSSASGWSSQKVGVGTSATDPVTLPTSVTAVLDMGSEIKFNQWKMYPRNHDLDVTRMFPIGYTVEISNNNSSWETIATITDGEVPAKVTDPAVVTLERAVSARYVRFTFTKINLPDTWKNNLHVQLAELELYFDSSIDKLQGYRDLFEAVEPAHFEGGEQIAVWLQKIGERDTLIAEAEALLDSLSLKSGLLPAQYLFYRNYWKTEGEWLITNAADLAALEQVSKSDSLTGLCFTQTADISMEGVDGFIGIGTAAHPFKGSYDGAFFKITDLSVVYNGVYNSGYGYGLFANISGGKVCNIRLLESSVQITITAGSIDSAADLGIGGIAGRTSDGAWIENCYNGAEVTVTLSNGENHDLSVGGLVGRGVTGTRIINCVNAGAVTSASHVSGINDWGQNGTNMSYIINCVNTGMLNGSDRYAIARYNDLSASVLQRYSRYSNNYWLQGTADSATNRDADLQAAENFSDVQTLVEGSIFYATGWKLEEDLLLPGSFAEGDINASGAADTADVICLMQWLVGHSQTFYLSADMNQDGRISIYDAVLLMRQISC